MGDGRHEFGPTASWERLRSRAALLAAIRRFFDERQFLEVDTPLLSHDSVVDRHLDPLPVWLTDNGVTDRVTTGPAGEVPAAEPVLAASQRGAPMWLQTSPEFGMKRLMAAGAEAIYQITRAFRGGERGPLHNPEFTIVEWYRAGDSMEAGIGLLDELAQATLDRGPAERVSYATAFERAVGIDPHRCALEQLADRARERGFVPSACWDVADRDAWLDWLLVTQVEPTLGQNRPVIVYDYPASQAALAQVRSQSLPVAERFELYVDGIELANGYHELLDPEVLASRTSAANAARQADGKYGLPEQSRLLSAMRHGLPPCTGVALGFDRLLMVAVGAADLSEVIAFPIERA